MGIAQLLDRLKEEPTKGLIRSSQDESKGKDMLAEGEEPMCMRAEGAKWGLSLLSIMSRN